MAEATEAAVAAATDMLTELVEKVPYTGEGQDPVATELGQVQPYVDSNLVAAPERASGQEAVVAQTEHETTPSYEVEIPQDLLDELDEPDFEAEARAEVTDDEIEYEDGDNEEKRKRIAAEKRVVWLEDRMAKQSADKWKTERDKYFPLAEVGYKALEALKMELPAPTSRRAYLKQARAVHEAMVPNFKPLVDKLSSSTAEVKQEALAEARVEAANAWGSPTTGPGTVPVLAGANNAELDKARKTGNLATILGVMRRQATGAKE